MPYFCFGLCGQLAVQPHRGLIGSALLQQISQNQTDLQALPRLQALVPGRELCCYLTLTSLLMLQEHQQLQTLEIIRMQPQQMFEAAPGGLGLAIATLQIGFEQGELARRGAAKQPRLQHHFGLLQAL